MKNILPLLFGAALLPMAVQATSTSNTVGYETLTLASGFNYVGVRLHEPVIASGQLVSAVGTTLTVADGVADELVSGTYIIEIGSGPIEAAINEVNSWDAALDTLTTDNDLTAAGLVGDEDFVIRKASTIETIFGAANEAGLTSTAAFASSDQVWLFNGTIFDKYYYALGVFGQPSAWKDSGGTTVDPATINLIYADSFLVNAVSGKDVVVTGEVKPSATMLALTGTFNYTGGIYPVGATIASTFGAANEAGLTSTAAFASSDQIWIFNGTNFDKYYYALGVFGQPSAWKDSSGATVDATMIDMPSGYLINNIGGDQAITVTAPESYDDL